MKLKNPFLMLTRFEWFLWIGSLLTVSASFLLPPVKDLLTLIGSLIGVTALIFLAKGVVIGQVLIVVFSVFYGIISFHFRYYGEMITYLGMTTPIAIATMIAWIRHPYRETAEVEVSRVTRSQVLLMLALSTGVTLAFYFILKALGNANLLISTVSVTTSFLAAYLTFLRSPWYALGYAANDAVLILLWILATLEDITSLPMVICFFVFLINDLYGFFCWRRMERRQHEMIEHL